MKLIYLLSFVLALISCSPKQNGYADLDKLYAGFVTALKGDTSLLKKYCHDITPDAGTIAYMKKINFSYRGIPQELEKQKVDIEEIGNKYYEEVLYFRNKLIEGQHLENLEYVGRELQGEERISKEFDIPFTEPFILIRSGNDTIHYKLGEMLRINGKWKAFTAPRL